MTTKSSRLERRVGVVLYVWFAMRRFDRWLARQRESFWRVWYGGEP
jgi:hypothetical protein